MACGWSIPTCREAIQHPEALVTERFELGIDIDASRIIQGMQAGIFISLIADRQPQDIFGSL